jgi:hypothetical protein
MRILSVLLLFVVLVLGGIYNNIDSTFRGAQLFSWGNRPQVNSSSAVNYKSKNSKLLLNDES